MFKVALLIESSRACERFFLQGIARYSRLHGPWSFYRQPGYYISSLDNRLSRALSWQPDGLIISDTEVCKDISHLNIPVIIHTIRDKVQRFPHIVGDTQRCAHLVADHLLGRGFKNFAFCGMGQFYWSQDRYDNFRDYLTAQGHSVEFYRLPATLGQHSWQAEQAKLIDWICQLPKPVGIMTCADDCSQLVLEACKVAHLKVPEEIALVGVDNDAMVCEFSNPPLSSVVMNFEGAGFEAAELLHGMMAGTAEISEKDLITVEPLRIQVRQSSNILAIDDPDVAEAIRFIRQTGRKMIQTEDVLRATGCSRRSLHDKFNRCLKRSVHQEIKRVRTDYIAELLLETDFSVSQIADKMGFSGVDHIARYFRQEKGMSLQQYRKKYGHK